MKLFCIVPTDWIVNGPPAGVALPPHPSTWIGCPGDLSRTLMRIDFASDGAAEAAWRATPGVIALPEHYKWFRPVPAVAVTLFGPWGVNGGDLMADAADKIRAAWAHFYP